MIQLVGQVDGPPETKNNLGRLRPQLTGKHRQGDGVWIGGDTASFPLSSSKLLLIFWFKNSLTLALSPPHSPKPSCLSPPFLGSQGPVSPASLAPFPSYHPCLSSQSVNLGSPCCPASGTTVLPSP